MKSYPVKIVRNCLKPNSKVNCKFIFLSYFFISELKETLESILSQNQVLSEVVKTVDSSCPDPFNDPEKFSVYFAQKTFSSRSISEDLENNSDTETSSPTESVKVETTENVHVNNSFDTENALLRLQNLRMEEQRGFQIERENYETRISQLNLLRQEIEMLRSQNSEHEIQLEFLKSSQNAPAESNENLKNQLLLLEEIQVLKNELEESRRQNDTKDAQIDAKSSDSDLQLENSQLKRQLEEALLQLKSFQESLEGHEERERQFREISEEIVRFKIQFGDLERELADTKTQLADMEVTRLII